MMGIQVWFEDGGYGWLRGNGRSVTVHRGRSTSPLDQVWPADGLALEVIESVGAAQTGLVTRARSLGFAVSVREPGTG